MTWLLTLLGTLVPAHALRSALYGALLAAIVAGGGWMVWTLRHQDEAPRIQRAAEAIVKTANLHAHVQQLEAAVKQGADTLAAREKSLAKSGAEIAKLKKALEDKRNASPNPDDIVIPAGDPWLGGVRE